MNTNAQSKAMRLLNVFVEMLEQCVSGSQKQTVE